VDSRPGCTALSRQGVTLSSAGESGPGAAIRDKALGLGFDAVGFAAATLHTAARDGLTEFIKAGYHGDMGWLAERAVQRASPDALWPDTKSVVVVGLNYGPPRDPLAPQARPERGTISTYARGRDYHDVLKKKLRVLARFMADDLQGDVKLFVDTAPVMEKPLAMAAGVGWQGKHTNLVSREHGSWLFLGEIYTTLDLSPDEPGVDRCGGCSRCLDICPTNAFSGPYKLDARRCISYLTIEHKGHIPREFRDAMGNRIYGCDDCLAVCPWNKFATPVSDPELAWRLELTWPHLADFALLDDASFREVFSTSPIKRLGRDRFIRNVLIAIGNSGEPQLAARARGLLSDPSPLVRAMAVWALRKLVPRGDFMNLSARYRDSEPDDDVREEWNDRE
jgi:epoxyqueuosine reductase